jgi:hypothetical protein
MLIRRYLKLEVLFYLFLFWVSGIDWHRERKTIVKYEMIVIII